MKKNGLLQQNKYYSYDTIQIYTIFKKLGLLLA